MKYIFTLILVTIFCAFANAQKVDILKFNNSLDSNLVTIFKNNKGELFAFSKEKELFKYEKSNWQLKKQVSEISFFSMFGYENIGLSNVFVDNSNNLWLTFVGSSFLSNYSLKGIYSINLDSFNVLNLTYDDDFSKMLDGKIASDIAYSKKEDCIYIPTLGNGIIKYKNNIFEKYATYNSELMDNVINKISIADNGVLWLASSTSGILEFDISKKTCKSFNKDNTKISGNEIVLISANQSNIFAVCDDNKENLYHKVDAEFEQYVGDNFVMPNGEVKFIERRSKGTSWVMVSNYNNNTLLKINGESVRIFSDKKFPFLNDEITRIVAMENGNVFLSVSSKIKNPVTGEEASLGNYLVLISE